MTCARASESTRTTTAVKARRVAIRVAIWLRKRLARALADHREWSQPASSTIGAIGRGVLHAVVLSSIPAAWLAVTFGGEWLRHALSTPTGGSLLEAVRVSLSAALGF